MLNTRLHASLAREPAIFSARAHAHTYVPCFVRAIRNPTSSLGSFPLAKIHSIYLEYCKLSSYYIYIVYVCAAFLRPWKVQERLFQCGAVRANRYSPVSPAALWLEAQCLSPAMALHTILFTRVHWMCKIPANILGVDHLTFPNHDRHTYICTYIYAKNRSLIQSLALMCLAIIL